MKKFIFISFLSFITLMAQAQLRGVQFGIKAGLNIADQHSKNGADVNSILGLHAGALAHIHITSHFAVQPEVMYSAQGGKEGNVTSHLGYINVPLLLQYMMNAGFRLQTGPQVGFLISAKTERPGLELDINNQVEKAELAWVFGASYLTSVGLGIDARYNLGITNNNALDPSEAWQNRVVQIGLFYQFKH
jgi:hypothetical protein